VNNKAVKVYVKVGMLTSNMAQVSGNINLGDQVVVAGQQKLTDGNAIKILEVQTIDDSPQSAQNMPAAKMQQTMPMPVTVTKASS
jgi:hypothetical protein